jgi:hypothetical protein
MPQIFHRSFNTLSKVSIFGSLFILAGLVWAAAKLNRSPYMTGAGVPRDQAVPFSHQHHVAGLGIDCRYCHTSVEQSSFAGIPSTKTCMNCHNQIWTFTEMLEPVRESFRNNKPLVWTRVHNLPDFVYFDHSIHVNKGIGCVSCHGRVDKMPLTWQVATLHMDWCLECHREPERFVRPRDKVFDMAWESPPDQISLGRKLVKKYNIGSVQRLTSCSTCHR